jgi:transposase
MLEEHLLITQDADSIFVHNSASIHTAMDSRTWLKDNGVEVMHWPAYSPDLSPIEHLWFPLKNTIYK